MVDLIEFVIVNHKSGYVRWATDRFTDATGCSFLDWVLWHGPRDRFVP